MTVTHTFRGPKITVEHRGECPTCGKPSKRSRTFERTVNPWNTRDDGTPKSWDEVRADVQRDADAWAPEPAEFEHEKCMAGRMAPPVAEPVTMSDQDVQRASTLRLLLADAILWLERSGMPASRLIVGTGRGGHPTAAPDHFVHDGYIVLWARALGLDSVRVEDGGHCTYVRMRAEIGGMRWSVDGLVQKPRLGDALGDAPVSWGRDERTGRRARTGTVSVDELAAGLARMGIAEVRS